MPDRLIRPRPLTREAFAPFGDVIDRDGISPRPMNGDRARRYHALATAEALGEGASVIVSLVESHPVSLPLSIAMVERHPHGSQAFVPLSQGVFLVVVCPDRNGRPGDPLAFVTRPGQGVNYRTNAWHGILAPLDSAQSFLIVDRGGDGANLEEFFFEEAWRIEGADPLR